MEFNGTHALITILALIVGGLALRQLMKSKRRRDSELTSRPDDASGEENDALQRDSESTSRTDDASGEKYDVFLSFRGSDTRQNFTDILYHSMVRVGIRVFLDNDELDVGGDKLLKAVRNSQIYIPIFSQHYADSVWCLREVECMVECHSEPNEKKEIIPIFYDVTPDDVKLKTIQYKKALRKHRGRYDSSRVQQWENALQTVGRIRGLELQGKSQGEQIESLVEVVCRKLDTRHTTVTENLVEDNAQMETIMKLLDVGSDGVRFVGIHGMGGVGKTALAKVMFNKLSSHFEGCCFLEDVRASSQPHDGLLNLQKKLLSSFVGSSITDQIKDVHGGITRIKGVFRNKKVLIVLDDLDNKEQLQMLAGKSDWFCSGSRIIITTREEGILKTQVDQSKGILAHEVHPMRFDLALRLFYKYAFRSDFAVKGYEDISSKIVKKVGMLPLAVVVIGSHLFDLGNHLTNSVRREVWDEVLEQLEEGPFHNVRNALMISYERLKDMEKEVFLDIVCFFNNEDSTYPFIMWKDCGYKPHTTMGVLSHRSLIKIREDNRFWMHDQVRDFGRYIALQEYPRKICRVWTGEKALELLQRKERNEDVVALSLDFDGRICNIASEKSAALPNLRFLRVKGVDFFGNFENLLSELRWFSWEITQMEFHGKSFHFANLIVLDLSRSDIEDDWVGWSQIQMTKKLKVLDLTDCTKLTKTPDFTNFTSLETLVLAGCSNLVTIHPSISKLQLLETLNIKGCSCLGELPEEIGSLQSLKQIIMPQNFQPLKLPESFGNLKSLESFRLSYHPKICKLPNSIGGAANLKCLTLRECVGIEELPSSIGELQMLEELDISSSGIVELPNSIGNLKKLKVLSFCRTKIKEIPRTIGELEMLEGLYAHQSWDLTDKNLEEIGKLRHLKTLNLAFTSVSRLPAEISHLHLQKLEVGSIELQQVPALPSSLKFLAIQALDFSLVPDPSSITCLEHLELQRFSNSTNIPRSTCWDYHSKIEAASMREQHSYQLPSHLSTLKLRGISPLPHFSNLSKLTVLHVIDCAISHLPINPGLTHLRELFIRRCKSLEKILDLSLLRNLERLELEGLNRLVEIQGLSELESLRYFRISSCDLIGQLPNLSKLGKLQRLELEACPNLRAIEGIEGLESWVLDTCGRTVLERFLNISRSTWLSLRLSRYDVFLSSKGAHIHRSIVSNLHNWMLQKKISVYSSLDDYRFKEGIGEKILQALANSNIYIPVFSRNYASSHWCLRELACMVKYTSESKGKRRILPIFYDVDIDDVNLETDLYNRALNKHRTNFDHNEVKSWKEALIEVAAMRGFVLKNTSHEEVFEEIGAEVFGARILLNVDSRSLLFGRLSMKSLDEIIVQEGSCMPDAEYLVEDHQIKAVTEKLDVDSNAVRVLENHGVGGIDETVLANAGFNKSTSEEEDQNQPKRVLAYAIAAVQNVVGIDDRAKQTTDLLEMEVNDEVRILGIYGADGIGKTTLARAVYDRISSCFDGRSFLAEVKETTQDPDGIQFLQTKLICDILQRGHEDPSFDERIEDFLDIFREMKVLIVIDDVKEQSHLHAIVGEQLHLFGPGSRIIVTSENEEILKEYDPEKACTYMVSELDDGQAFELFCKHAFGIQSSRPDYIELADCIVNVIEKLPLAVEVVGSFLRGKSIQEWENMEESMKARATSSQRTRVGLEEILDICYKGLHEEQKVIFLDIACFISGVDAQIASYMWPSSSLPSSDCILMPLAKIGENNELQMHGLLRCHGKKVCKQEESQDPSSRRFCTQDMVLKAMNRDMGKENVEAFCFDFTAENFQSMPDIRFLKLDNAKASGDFAGAFASLRWLCWQTCPPDFSAENLVLRELVILDLSWSKVTEDWGGWRKIKMEKLKVLNLTGCSDLLFTPDFSGYRDLEILILEGCSRLVKLDPSVGHLKRLVSLNMKFCSQLNGLPVELGYVTALKELLIDGTSVRQIPISIGNLNQLEILSGFNCFPLTRLPSSVCYLTLLSKLSLDGAKITELPSSLGDLLKLRHLSLRDCRYLEKLPYSIGEMGSLEELDISATSISELPSSIRNLESLKVLRMNSSFIRAFPKEIGNLTNLKELHASWCLNLKGAIPSNIEGLCNLRSLTLGRSSISSLPPEISTIPDLHTLDLIQCNEIEELPKLPPSLIHLRVSSKRLKAIPLLEDLKELEELCLSDGDPKVGRPPSKWPMPESNVIDEQSFSISFPKLRKLELSLSQVIKLKFELTDIPPLKRLKTLTLPGLSHKEVSELPKMLSVLKLYDSAIEEIEGLEGLEALKRLEISNCKIQNLHGIGQITSLRSLILSDCDDLSSPDLSNLKSLKVLEIRRCKMIQQIEGLEKLTSLGMLNICECPAENSVQVQQALKHVMARSTVK